MMVSMVLGVMIVTGASRRSISTIGAAGRFNSRDIRSSGGGTTSLSAMVSRSRATASPAGGRSLMNRFRKPSPRAFATGLATEDAVLRPDPVAEMTDATFFEALNGHATIVDLWAPWSEPCKTLAPIVDKPARKHANQRVHFMRVNVDDCPNIATGLGVMITPSLVLFNDDERI